MRIGVCGRICAGKTTFARALSLSSGVHSFSGSLKDVINTLLRMAGHEIDKESVRSLYQQFGSLMRAYDRELWVKILLNHIRQVHSEEDIVIDDVRYINEYETLMSHGYEIVAIVPTDKQLVMNYERSGRVPAQDADNHESEQEAREVIERAFWTIRYDDTMCTISNKDGYVRTITRSTPSCMSLLFKTARSDYRG